MKNKEKSEQSSQGKDPAWDVFDKKNVLEKVNRTKLNATDKTFKVVHWSSTDDGTPINYSLFDTVIGEILIASTGKGVCFLGFGDDKKDMSMQELRERFPGSVLTEGKSEYQEEAVKRINYPDKEALVHLHLKGTPFQLRVWEKILRVPFGGLITYGQLSQGPHDARAVGNAVGANPVCLVIGCHRVVHTDGDVEGFHYGTEIKKKLLAYESANSAS